MKIVAKNKKAFFSYEILDKYIAGMVLAGWQVKSIKNGGASIKEAYAYVHKGEMFLKSAQIAVWKGMGEIEKSNAGKDIKLLLHKGEIEKIAEKLATKGLTLVPIAIGEERGRLKLEIGLARGKKLWDKRASTKNRESKRDIQRELKGSKYF